MRVIERKMLNAIINGKNFKSTNTQVENTPKCCNIYLYDTLIAEVDRADNTLSVHNCRGWRSATTKSRLNAILGLVNHFIYQRDFVWYFSDGSEYTPRTFHL